MSTEPESVTTRCVFYFGGFDPRGAGRYHKLFRKEADRYQNEHTTITTGPRLKSADSLNYWRVEFTEKREGKEQTTKVNTTHVFMSWDDIIRKYWPNSAIEIISSFFSIYFCYDSWTALNRVRKNFYPAFFSGLLPLAFFVLYVANIGAIFHLTRDSFKFSSFLALQTFLKLTFHIFMAIAVTYFFYFVANRIGIFWLIRIYRFNIFFAKQKIEEIKQRQEEWVEKIISQQIENPADEIIFSGHSVGTLLVIGVIDKLLNDKRWIHIQRGTKTQLLTLGQCYPFITSMPCAVDFRKCLQRICTNKNVVWLDVTARIDPLCFHSMHPLQHTDIDTRTLIQPVLYSARFFKMYNAAHWKKIKRNKMLVHFLYLMTPDKKNGFNVYDFFYGPDTFQNKFLQLTHARKSD
jgi:hypothetical protein